MHLPRRKQAESPPAGGWYAPPPDRYVPGYPGIPGRPTTVLQMPPIYNDVSLMLRDQRAMTQASLDQQREMMQYMTTLNDWLRRDVLDRQAERRDVVTSLNALRDAMGVPDMPRRPVSAYPPDQRPGVPVIPYRQPYGRGPKDGLPGTTGSSRSPVLPSPR